MHILLASVIQTFPNCLLGWSSKYPPCVSMEKWLVSVVSMAVPGFFCNYLFENSFSVYQLRLVDAYLEYSVM